MLDFRRSDAGAANAGIEPKNDCAVRAIVHHTGDDYMDWHTRFQTLYTDRGSDRNIVTDGVLRDDMEALFKETGLHKLDANNIECADGRFNVEHAATRYGNCILELHEEYYGHTAPDCIILGDEPMAHVTAIKDSALWDLRDHRFDIFGYERAVRSVWI